MGGAVGCMIFLLVCGVLAFPIWILVETLNRRSESKKFSTEFEKIRGSLNAIRRQVSELHERLQRLEQGSIQIAPEVKPEAISVPVTLKPVEPVEAIKRVEPVEAVAPEPALVPEVVMAPPEPEVVVQPCAVAASQPEAPPPLPPPASEDISKKVEKTPSEATPHPRRPPLVSPPSRQLPVPEPSKPFDWESLVGVKLFSWVAGVALLVAAIAFLRYGIDHGWLTAPVRMAIGLVFGVGLLVACETKRAQEYDITAQALTAGGIATLFSTFFAAHALWHLIPSSAAFLMMVLVTVVAVTLSIRRDSIFIALLGLLGGFLTPVMLSTGEDRPFGLFGYLAMLNIGLAWVARRKRWPVLTAFSMGFTALYQLGWVMKFLNESKLGIGVGIFLLFPILAFGAVYFGQAQEDRDEASGVHPIFRYTATFSAIPPLLFALHFAATPAYGEHYVLMLGFLFLVAAGLAVIALVRGPEWLHLLGGVSTIVILATWLGNGYRHEAWPGVLVFLALFVVLYVGMAWLPTRSDRLNPFEKEGRWAVYTAPLLLFAFPVLLQLEPATASPGLLFGVLLGLMALLAAYSIHFEEGFIHFTACFFVLAAEAIWSTRYLDAKHLLSGLLVYGGFGLFYLGIPLLAQQKGRELRPQGSGAILAFASLALLFFLTSGPIAHASLWALAVLVGILNLGLMYEASCGHHPILAFLGMVLSWILLVVWWISAPLVGMLVPALVVMAAFAMLVVGGSLWLTTSRSSSASGAAVGNPGVFLGLAGHLFLLAVAAQPRLSLPPWPWLAVLLVLDLALGAAALYLKRGAILLGSAILTQVVLMAWVAMVPSQSQGLPMVVGPWSAMVFAGLGYGIYEMARTLRMEEGNFPLSAGIGLVLAQILLCLLCSTPQGATEHGLFLFTNLVLAFGLLSLAWRNRAYGWALVLVFSSGLVLLTWYFGGATRSLLHTPQEHAAHFLQLAVPLYLLQLAFPLVLGTRARSERLPFLAAILASGVFFLLARPSLVTLGYGDIIGALPVLQAILLVPHLLSLLRLEPEGKRDLARLAMVAGAMLAFITVAIPLQLEKQWITLGWALLGMALAWLYGRVPHKGLLVSTAGLLATVFVRLVLNPSVFGYHARSSIPIFNWYLYTYLVTAACFLGAAWLLKRLDDKLLPDFPSLSTLLTAGGTVILFLLLNIEIADLFSDGPQLAFRLLHGSLAQDLSYTIGWALFSIGMLVAGLVARSRATRVAAILLLTMTVLKAFLHDLANLAGLYRVASFVGLAICLAAVAVVLQKFVLRRSGEAK